ncbi:MAG: hypothetical protein H0U05_03530, partial [Actinobacteria bacterium]|nr:hypothetical protein [Actinomycetota bacterium]
MNAFPALGPHEVPEPDPNTVISARGVEKHYGRTVALAGLDADIGPGITGLLGSNGAGKSRARRGRAARLPDPRHVARQARRS